MKLSILAGLSALLVAGCVQAQAQDADVQTELASQRARIAELEKQFAAKPANAPFQFPQELTPYVLIDATLVNTSNNTATGKSKLDFSNSPWFSADRWGLRGKLDSNVAGLSLIYKLESQFGIGDGGLGTTNVVTAATPAGTTPTNGGTEAVLFNRDAWVGLGSSSLGQITIGRQNTLARDFSAIYGDPFGPAPFGYEESGWTNSNNFKDLVNFAGSVDGSRMNKGMVWKKIMTNGVTMGLAYNLSDDTLVTPYANNVTQANTTTRDTTACVALGYNAKAYNLSAYYTQANNAGFTQKSYSVGGNAEVTRKLRLNAGLFRYSADQGPTNGQRTDNAFSLSASYAATYIWSYYLGYQGWKANKAGLSSATNGNMTMPFANGNTAKAVGSGARNTTYGAIMRSLSKRAEVYVCADYEQLTEDFRLAAANGYRNQTELGIGIRIRAL